MGNQEKKKSVMLFMLSNNVNINETTVIVGGLPVTPNCLMYLYYSILPAALWDWQYQWCAGKL